jgi:NhaA family Na+:H+ antiporter
MPQSKKSLLTGFKLFVREESFGGVLLLVAVLAALLWANSAYAASYFELWDTVFEIGFGEARIAMSLHHWINDGLMAIFFFVVGLEIKREILIGELSKPRQALFPVVAAIGGMLAPALIYVAINRGGAAFAGWGVPMATDIAFALGVLALLGKRVPISLKIFLTAVAIVDDIGAVLVIAVFYSGGIAWGSLGLAAVVVLMLALLNSGGVRRPIPYAVLGVLLWLAFLHSGVHATVAGVLLAATIPARQRIDGESFLQRSQKYLQAFSKASVEGPQRLINQEQWDALHGLENSIESVNSPLQRLEHAFHPWVVYAIMPVFALANAGVVLPANIIGAATAPVSLGILWGLVLGKQLGIFGLPWLLTRLGWLSKPRGLGWTQIYGAAWLGGIGFTMSLFITNLAFGEGELATLAKVGILLASALAAFGGSLVLLLANRRERA